MPEIEVVQPEFNDITNSYSIAFNATLINTRSCKVVKFRNKGEIACKVILEVWDDSEDVFTLMPQTDTLRLLHLWTTEGVYFINHYFTNVHVQCLIAEL